MPDDMEESEESEDADDEVTVIFSRGKMDFLSPLGSRRCFFWEDCYGVFVSLFVCLFVKFFWMGNHGKNEPKV